jgi:hypothetical protein
MGESGQRWPGAHFHQVVTGEEYPADSHVAGTPDVAAFLTEFRQR